MRRAMRRDDIIYGCVISRAKGKTEDIALTYGMVHTCPVGCPSASRHRSIAEIDVSDL